MTFREENIGDRRFHLIKEGGGGFSQISEVLLEQRPTAETFERFVAYLPSPQRASALPENPLALAASSPNESQSQPQPMQIDTGTTGTPGEGLLAAHMAREQSDVAVWLENKYGKIASVHGSGLSLEPTRGAEPVKKPLLPDDDTVMEGEAPVAIVPTPIIPSATSAQQPPQQPSPSIPRMQTDKWHSQRG